MEGVIGYVTLFAGNFNPKNWAFCSGQIINIASNTAFFSILGTTYGGNGTTTFGLPDLRGRVVIGAGQGPGLTSYSLGQSGGTETVTLTLQQLPAHVHPVSYVTTPPAGSTANTSVATGQAYSGDINGNLPYVTSPPNVALAPYQGTLITSNNGSNQPISLLNPFLGLGYIICMYGVYPARN